MARFPVGVDCACLLGSGFASAPSIFHGQILLGLQAQLLKRSFSKPRFSKPWGVSMYLPSQIPDKSLPGTSGRLVVSSATKVVQCCRDAQQQGAHG